MIIVKLFGGLGNQMFQYSTARHLAEINNTTLKLDLTDFNNLSSNLKKTYRKYALFIFNINENLASKSEIERYSYNPKGIIDRLLKRVKYWPNKYNYIYEDHFHFNKDLLAAPDNSYLEGYWQSEKYFIDINNIIRKEFTLKPEFNVDNVSLIKNIQNNQSISIHVRRGDYINNKTTNNLHGTCNLKYYHEAVQYICKKVKDPYFFIFSDDSDWTRCNIKLDFPTKYVTENKNKKSYMDMILMSLCKHNIIANSSFSWWGAWLNMNKGKIVVAPKKWFNEFQRNTKDLLPENWIKI